MDGNIVFSEKLAAEHISLEQFLLGSILIRNGCLNEIEKHIDSTDFSKWAHVQTYTVIRDEINEGVTVDLIHLEHVLTNKNLMESVGGFAYIATIMKNTPSAANAENYAKKLGELSVIRKRHLDLLNAVKGDEGAFERVRRNEYSIIKQQDTFKVYSGFEGYDIEVPFLIKGYIPSDSFGVVFGASGSFKSFLAMSWACHIAAGRDWNGQVVDTGNVLYVIGEGGSGASRRFKAWSDAYNDGSNLTNLYYIKQPAYVTVEEECIRLIKTIEKIEKETETPFKLVVLDTLARCFAGGDENKAADMNKFIAGCDHIKAKTGATVLIVHHTGKSEGQGARGSSALRAACDFEFRVKRPDMVEGHEVFITHEKAKDSEQRAKEAFSVSEQYLFTDSDGEDVTSLVLNDAGYEPIEESSLNNPVTKESERILLDVLNDNGGSMHNKQLNDEFCHKVNPEINGIDPIARRKERQKLNKRKNRVIDDLINRNIITVNKDIVAIEDNVLP